MEMQQLRNQRTYKKRRNSFLIKGNISERIFLKNAQKVDMKVKHYGWATDKQIDKGMWGFYSLNVYLQLTKLNLTEPCTQFHHLKHECISQVIDSNSQEYMIRETY